MSNPLIVACSAAAVSAAVLFLLLRSGWAWRIATDVPNPRSLHVRPTPRVGGWGIVLAILVVSPASGLFAALKLVVVLLATVSFLDDRFDLSSRLRFAFHLLAALVWVVLNSDAMPHVGVAGLCVLLMVWMANLYNFMDGADGMAGGMAVFGFSAMALAARFAGQHELAAWCVVCAGGSGGFLLFNFPPARVFMGDGGSVPLGFLAGALGMVGVLSETWPWWFAPMVFSPFIFDATATLLRRMTRGDKFWQAHREHHYQRMVQSGFGHRNTALIWYGVMLTSSLLAFVALWADAREAHAILIFWLLVLIVLGRAVDRRWAKYINEESRSNAQAEH